MYWRPSNLCSETKPCGAVDLLSKLEPINYLSNIVCLMFLVQLVCTVHTIKDLKQRRQRLLRKRHFKKWICAASNFIALIHVVVVQRRLRNVQKKRDARAKLLFGQSLCFPDYSCVHLTSWTGDSCRCRQPFGRQCMGSCVCFNVKHKKNTISRGFSLIPISLQNPRWWPLLVTSQASSSATTHKIYLILLRTSKAFH